MPRRSSANPSKTSSQFLHPTLQAALESLDVQLDEELARYRRLRSRKSRATERSQTRDRHPSTIAVAAIAGVSQPQHTIADLPSVKTPEAAAIEQNVRTSELAPMAIAAGLSQTDAVPIARNAAQADLATLNTQTLVSGAGSLDPDDYLESSEELLKSIAEEENLRAEREPGMLESLLTPLGIGSMLLLLLSSVTFGYLIMNPESLNLLGVNRLSSSEAPTSSTASADATASPAAPAVPAVPNLANQEFVDLNLDTLSTLPTERSPQLAASPAPVTPPSSSASTRPAPIAAAQPIAPVTAEPTTPQRRTSQEPAAPARRRATQPTASRPPVSRSTASRSEAPARRQRPVAVRPAPPPVQPAPAQPSRAPAAAASTAASPQPDLYYVTTEYNSDRNLEQAREAVGDAYVRNFPSSGARVQLGAFSERERAQELIQDLQEQGIPAQIQQP